jgi:primosomal protein N' (replication factor Y)
MSYWLQVVVATPAHSAIAGPLTYHSESPLTPGTLVRVPLGKREVLGVVWEVLPDSGELPEVKTAAPTLLASRSSLPPEGAVSPWGGPAVKPAAPTLGTEVSSLPPEGAVSPWGGPAVKTRAIASVLDGLAPLSATWRKLVTFTAGYYQRSLGEVALAALPPQLRELSTLQLARRLKRPVVDTSDPKNTTDLIALSADQARVLAEFDAESLGRSRPALLFGATGSGKTEVYLALIESVLARGQQALVLVPEIGLTPQLLNRFRERLPAPVLALHSALSAGQRSRTWQRVRSATPLVLVGTRSAVFAPFAALGLVVVDEEHDPSFKQQEGFRYHARDLALVRAQRLRIPVLMGSATPALESLHNVALGRYQRLSLPARAGFAKPPTVQLLDLRRATLDEGLSAPALQAIGEHLDRGEQVLVFKNRRGFAPVLQCRSCGWHAECDRCDRPFTWHRRKHRLVCHRCGRERPVPAACPVCGDTPSALGIGTERLEDFLRQRFPTVAVIRVDRDSAGGSGGMEKLLAPAYAGAPCVLVGTQILAKGHDLPKLTLALIVDADQGLFSQDFRSGERMAQLIVQVAGRAGRSHQAGRVLIQTHHPEHPLFAQLLQGGYAAFAEAELALRSSLSFPPFAALALVSAEASDESPLRAFFAAARAGLDADPGLQILGPMPGQVPRRAGQTRWQMLLQTPQRKQLQQILPRFTEHLYAIIEGKRVRWSLDVDPLDFA